MLVSWGRKAKRTRSPISAATLTVLAPRISAGPARTPKAAVQEKGLKGQGLGAACHCHTVSGALFPVAWAMTTLMSTEISPPCTRVVSTLKPS